LNAEQIQQHLRANHGLRVGQHTAQYILSKLDRAKTAFPIFATDARTGQPLHPKFDPTNLDRSQPTLF
jgi:hypothetical protein